MKEILERLEQKMDAGFAKVDERFVKMDERLDSMDRRFDSMDARFGEVDGRLGSMDSRFDEVDRQLQKQGVLLESVSGDVKMALEGITGNREVADRQFAEVLKKLDERPR